MTKKTADQIIKDFADYVHCLNPEALDGFTGFVAIVGTRPQRNTETFHYTWTFKDLHSTAMALDSAVHRFSNVY